MDMPLNQALAGILNIRLSNIFGVVTYNIQVVKESLISYLLMVHTQICGKPGVKWVRNGCKIHPVKVTVAVVKKLLKKPKGTSSYRENKLWVAVG